MDKRLYKNYETAQLHKLRSMLIVKEFDCVTFNDSLVLLNTIREIAREIKLRGERNEK
jgi:hypothetical protein